MLFITFSPTDQVFVVLLSFVCFMEHNNGLKGRSLKITKIPYILIPERWKLSPFHWSFFLCTENTKQELSHPREKDVLFWMSSSLSTTACSRSKLHVLGVLPVCVLISVCLFLPLTEMQFVGFTQQFAEIQQDLWFMLPSMNKHNTLKCLREKKSYEFVKFLNILAPHLTPILTHEFTVSPDTVIRWLWLGLGWQPINPKKGLAFSQQPFPNALSLPLSLSLLSLSLSL